MKKLTRRQWLALTIGSGVLAGTAYLSLPSKKEIPRINYSVPRKKDKYLAAKNANPKKRQEFLDEMFKQAEAPNLEKIIYDADFSQAMSIIEQMAGNSGANPEEILTAKYQFRQNQEGKGKAHFMYVPSLIISIGDGRKRTALVKPNLFESDIPGCESDVISFIEHEDEHAKQGKEGYIGVVKIPERITPSVEYQKHGMLIAETPGKVLLYYIIQNQIRTEILSEICEIPAYARQLENAINGRTKISENLFKKTSEEFEKRMAIYERALNKNALTPIEKQFVSPTIVHYQPLRKILNSIN